MPPAFHWQKLCGSKEKKSRNERWNTDYDGEKSRRLYRRALYKRAKSGKESLEDGTEEKIPWEIVG